MNLGTRVSAMMLAMCVLGIGMDRAAWARRNEVTIYEQTWTYEWGPEFDQFEVEFQSGPPGFMLSLGQITEDTTGGGVLYGYGGFGGVLGIQWSSPGVTPDGAFAYTFAWVNPWPGISLEWSMSSVKVWNDGVVLGTVHSQPTPPGDQWGLFNTEGTLIGEFTMVETETPAPGTVGLLTIAGAAVRRRRRLG